MERRTPCAPGARGRTAPVQGNNHTHWEFFFLTGPISGRTVFCIDIGNITLIHMVKLHLPHMYMIFMGNFKENNNSNLFYDTRDLFNTFGVIRIPLEPFISNSLGTSQFLQRHFLLFCGFDHRAFRVFRSFSRLL